MMMNDYVESGGVNVRGVDALDEQRAAVHRTLKRIAKARAHLDLQEAEALREAQRLQLWRELGHVSLADYMVRELGYASHRVAEDRLRVANALPALPELSKAIENGEINFSQARELVRVVTSETEQAWLGRAQNMNVREVEQAVAGRCKGALPDDPVDPRLVRKTLWLSVRPETEVMFREVRQVIEKEKGERLDDDAVMEALCRAYLSGMRTRREVESDPRGCEVSSNPRGCEGSSEAEGAESWEPGRHDGAAPYRVAVTVCSECRKGWQHGGGAVEAMTPAAVARAQCDAQWIGDLNSMLVERARQEIAPATRRKVLHRDKGRCRVPGCTSHKNLDVHHWWHVADGGGNELWNLITLCEAHHLCHHAGTLLIDRVGDELRFRHQPGNSFTRATRIVATKEALRERGLSGEQVLEVMQRTLAHVGRHDLGEQEWISTALVYSQQLSVGVAGVREEA